VSSFISVVTLLTQALMKLPVIEKIIRDIVSTIDNAIKKYDQVQFEKKLEEAAAKAIKNKDTSDLEKLAGKK